MNFTDKQTYTCVNCGSAHEIETQASINIRENPELKEKVCNGSLFLWECPHCGTNNLSVFECIYHDPDNRLMIWLLPGSGIPDSDKIKSLVREIPDYTLRKVNDAGSLIEKVKINEAGLDDMVIEMCKYVTIMEMTENGHKFNINPEDGISSLKFYKLDGADNSIIFAFPVDGEIKLISAGLNVYEDCRRILSGRSEFQNFETFAEIDSKWLMSILK